MADLIFYQFLNSFYYKNYSDLLFFEYGYKYCFAQKNACINKIFACIHERKTTAKKRVKI